eukprot:scaffold40014_cov38-Phaeocystis_antarctica.AAC.1
MPKPRADTPNPNPNPTPNPNPNPNPKPNPNPNRFPASPGGSVSRLPGTPSRDRFPADRYPLSHLVRVGVKASQPQA